MNANVVTKPVLATVIPPTASVNAAVQQCVANYELVNFEQIDALLDTATAVHPDLILCYQEALQISEIETLDAITRRFPYARLLLIGPDCPMTAQIQALKHGARGYFNQDFALDKLDYALNAVLHGEVWVARHTISGLIDELAEANVPSVSDKHKHALDTLSPKELEVAKQVSHGATNKMIARSMDITERTVKAHLTTIFQKMQIPDRLSLAILFRDLRR